MVVLCASYHQTKAKDKRQGSEKNRHKGGRFSAGVHRQHTTEGDSTLPGDITGGDLGGAEPLKDGKGSMPKSPSESSSSDSSSPDSGLDCLRLRGFLLLPPSLNLHSFQVRLQERAQV